MRKRLMGIMSTRIKSGSLLTTLLTVWLLFVAGNVFAQFDPAIYYRITAKHSDKCLAVADGMRSLRNGDRVIQSGCNDAEDNQKWQVIAVGDGYYKILAKHSGKGLNVFGGTISTGNGVLVQQWDYVGADNQKWKIVPTGDGYHTIIAKHSGKGLEFSGGVGAIGDGEQAQQWDYVGNDNQKWRFTPISGGRRVMTRFDPVTNGFQFDNSFKNDGGGGWKTDGLCGGMMYAAMDYFISGGRISRIDYRPSIGTILQTYLYERQVIQVAINLDRFENMILGSGPAADKKSYFERGIKEDTLRELRTNIDRGTPVVLALQNADNALGHSVLAIGYDMGRYQGDLGEHKEDLSIFVYDPNHPRQIRILTPDVATQRYVYRAADGQAPDPDAKWLTYFADTRYRAATAPTIPELNLGGPDGLVRELRLTLVTGGDELVGNNDEVEIIIQIDGRPPLVFANLNNRMRWMSFYDQTISLPLNTPVRAADIRGFVLKKSVRLAANGADNWDLDGVSLSAYGGFTTPIRLVNLSGQPLMRFTQSNTTLSTNIPR